jgi:hypothetical protein
MDEEGVGRADKNKQDSMLRKALPFAKASWSKQDEWIKKAQNKRME